ncbi:glycoside hydrolase family protein [Rubellicoccus peritrichatus]|uniref:Glycoside hydrolase family protein n=1 Tax=Rubellicoccus peritrichatus TaxID=3080537 RepID=A0AAQ3L6B9_9BACT|nr:glycoside hydrolase family protein [Puniceicoccus sp. CR14]WOO39771.1 glycoside hydrolase family protein [Puniceicoccus sp. CR14]
MQAHLTLDGFTLGTTCKAGGFSMPGYHVWCGAVIEAEDGKFHLFASRWKKDYPFTAWVTNSEIIRAVASSPDEPFHFEEVVLGQREEFYWDARSVHNPVIIKNPKGGYLLYYSGTTFKGDLNTVPPKGKKHYKQWLEAWNQQTIGVATAPAITGPWLRRDKPLLSPRPGKWDAIITTNPSVTYDPKLGWVMLYKSIEKPYVGDSLPAPFRFGICRSDNPEGPFTRLQDGPLFSGIMDADLEDPFIWHNGECLEMLAKDMNGAIAGVPRAGIRSWSHDGIHWEFPNDPCFYKRSLNWDDGSRSEQDFLERVWLLCKEGKPSHLYFATGNSGEGYFDIQDSSNIAVQLKRV